MNIRNLKLKDAPLMLEWMHDKSVVKDLRENFGDKTIEDCENFILRSRNDETNVHLAIVDDKDIYMGTVSLKHIDMCRKQAEFAIAMRSCAMGSGMAQYAMDKILRKGFKEMGLKRVYWCVSKNNRRARRFYEKGGYKEINVKDVSISGGGGTAYPNFRPISGIRQKDKKECRTENIEYLSCNHLKEKVFS